MLPLSVPLPDQPRDLRRVAVTHPPTRWPARAPTDTPGPRPPQAADPINDHEKVRKSRQDTSTPLSRASARWTPGPTPSLPPTPRARGLRRRVVNVHALVATGSTATGHREILGPSRLTPAGACRGNWGDLARRQLAALSQPLRGQARGRHPKSSWPWVRVLLHSVMTSPMLPRCMPNSTGSSTPWPRNSPRRRAPRWRPAKPACVHRVPQGGLAPISSNIPRTAKPQDPPMSWPSSPTSTPLSAWSALCSPSNDE